MEQKELEQIEEDEKKTNSFELKRNELRTSSHSRMRYALQLIYLIVATVTMPLIFYAPLVH